MKIKSFTHPKRGPFRKNKTPLRGIESFLYSRMYTTGSIHPCCIQLFTVQLSQIRNIRHLEV